MPITRKKQEYLNRYTKEHYKHYTIRIHLEKEAEIINHLDQMPNKTDYIKNLIIADMKNQG